MHLELKLTKFQSARVWLNELPVGTTFKPESTLIKKVDGGQSASGVVDAAAIEWLVPLGPRTVYGLLGGRLLPSADRSFTIEVGLSGEDGPQYESTLASKVSEDARVGLPAEYGQAVFDAAVGALRGVGHPVSGRIVFDHAAHGRVGSSPLIFSRLAMALIELLTSKRLPDQQSVEKILVWK